VATGVRSGGSVDANTAEDHDHDCTADRQQPTAAASRTSWSPPARFGGQPGPVWPPDVAGSSPASGPASCYWAD